MRYAHLLFCTLALQSVFSHGDEAAVLSPVYLQGTWSLDGKEGCGAGSARYVLFRNNGTLEVGQGAQAQRVGFWRIINDAIVANTLTAPNVTEEYHPFFRDSYRYEYVAPRVVKTGAESFTIEIGSDLEKEKQQVELTRCP